MPKRRMSDGVVTETPCPVPGCTSNQMVGNLVCLWHAVEIWQNVQKLKGDPLIHQTMVESVAERERRQADDDRKRIEFNKQHGTIYFIQVDEKIKIGWTSNLPQRLQSYPPHMILLTAHDGNRADERDLHRTFKPSRASGREWYHPTPELLAHIERVREAGRTDPDVYIYSDHVLKMKAWADRQLKHQVPSTRGT